MLSESSDATSNIVLTFSDRHASISGALQTPARTAAVDYTVIAFSTNRTWWKTPFRRVQTTRPASDGQFVFPDLPPGEYFLAALTDVEPNEWQDAEFLSRLVGSSVRVTIGEGEQKVQDLRIVR